MDNDMLQEHYKKHFGFYDKVLFTYCPYRICPLGAHVDHQHGLVTGFAINYGVGIGYSVNDDELCVVVSHNYPLRKKFRVNEVIERQGDWADYIRGAVKVLQKHDYNLKYGIKAYIYGEMPAGGLSSSAATIIAFLKAITEANGIKLTNKELIHYSYETEAEFMRMSIGKLDPSCEVLCKKNKLLVLDTDTDKYKHVEMGIQNVQFKFLIVYCGKERMLASSYYNVRVDECKAAAFICNSYLGKYDRFNDTYLRDLNYDDFLKYQDKMPENFKKRALHYYTENERVRQGEMSWANGDIKEFGRLVTESGKSSIELYEAGSELLIDLYNIMSKMDGVYGTRFMGGGFNGSCLAIIDPQYEETITKNVRKQYIKLHPELVHTMQIFTCTSEDGAGE